MKTTNESAASESKGQCQQRVFSGERYDMQGHRCNRMAVAGGFCKLHDPSAVAAKKEARDAKWRKEFEESSAKRRIQAAAPDLLEAAKLLIQSAENEGWNLCHGTDEFRTGIGELMDAIAKAEGRS